jgi:hypothetical protein
VYYRLPRLRSGALRASLVRGLETCHREVGVFAARHLRLVQPYAVAVDNYLSLPESFLERPDRKQVLARAVFGSTIPDHVYARKKVRAQVGSAGGGGVLAMFHERGLDTEALKERFCQLHSIDRCSTLDRFMRGGRYLSRLPEPDAV